MAWPSRVKRDSPKSETKDSRHGTRGNGASARGGGKLDAIRRRFSTEWVFGLSGFQPRPLSPALLVLLCYQITYHELELFDYLESRASGHCQFPDITTSIDEYRGFGRHVVKRGSATRRFLSPNAATSVPCQRLGIPCWRGNSIG